jgi:V8-like Glu-specific endopeptidase
MADARVNKLHFWGESDGPMTEGDVARARPILGRGEPPGELQELQSKRYVYVRTAARSDPPSAEVTQLDGVGDEAHWRIAIDAPPEHLAGHLPGGDARMLEQDTLLAEIDPAADFTGYRPEWSDQLFQPRLVSSTAPPLRRFNGRIVRPLYIFGADDRRVFQDASYPWRCVGKLFNSDGFSGSASLVWGNTIITAGHMVPWNSISAGSWWMRFVPDYFDGQSLVGAGVESYVSDVRGYNTGVAGYDWAVAKLYTRLGDSLGYFGFNGYSSDWEDQSWWTCVGFPGDVAGGARPSWQGAISIHDDDGDSNGGQELESQTADLNHGDSGGPLFAWWSGDPRVIGVVSGEEQEYQFPFSIEDNNVFSSGSGFTNLIAWARSNW